MLLHQSSCNLNGDLNHHHTRKQHSNHDCVHRYHYHSNRILHQSISNMRKRTNILWRSYTSLSYRPRIKLRLLWHNRRRVRLRLKLPANNGCRSSCDCAFGAVCLAKGYYGSYACASPADGDACPNPDVAVKRSLFGRKAALDHSNVLAR